MSQQFAFTGIVDNSYIPNAKRLLNELAKENKANSAITQKVKVFDGEATIIARILGGGIQRAIIDIRKSIAIYYASKDDNANSHIHKQSQLTPSLQEKFYSGAAYWTFDDNAPGDDDTHILEAYSTTPSRHGWWRCATSGIPTFKMAVSWIDNKIAIKGKPIIIDPSITVLSAAMATSELIVAFCALNFHTPSASLMIATFNKLGELKYSRGINGDPRQVTSWGFLGDAKTLFVTDYNADTEGVTGDDHTQYLYRYVFSNNYTEDVKTTLFTGGSCKEEIIVDGTGTSTVFYMDNATQERYPPPRRNDNDGDGEISSGNRMTSYNVTPNEFIRSVFIVGDDVTLSVFKVETNSIATNLTYQSEEINGYSRGSSSGGSSGSKTCSYTFKRLVGDDITPVANAPLVNCAYSVGSSTSRTHDYLTRQLSDVEPMPPPIDDSSVSSASSFDQALPIYADPKKELYIFLVYSGDDSTISEGHHYGYPAGIVKNGTIASSRVSWVKIMSHGVEYEAGRRGQEKSVDFSISTPSHYENIFTDAAYKTAPFSTHKYTYDIGIRPCLNDYLRYVRGHLSMVDYAFDGRLLVICLTVGQTSTDIHPLQSAYVNGKLTLVIDTKNVAGYGVLDYRVDEGKAVSNGSTPLQLPLGLANY